MRYWRCWMGHDWLQTGNRTRLCLRKFCGQKQIFSFWLDAWEDVK